VGGGLAGLVCANYIAEKGLSVTLIEKKDYPFHRVCGEYISNETIPFLKTRGLFPEEFNPATITQFQLTSVNGRSAMLPLDLGGFGISRYTFDHFLYKKAEGKGVKFILNTEVEEVSFRKDEFVIKAGDKELSSNLVIGSFGKRSKLDLSMQRGFVQKRSPYVGVKYHIRTDHPADLISLHNFKDGYCGISKIEDNRYCLCYLTNAANLKKSNNSIPEMERNILSRNPHLENIFKNSNRLFKQPLSISQISFQQKSQVENHVILIGDAAGMITPLCGNGMSMAMHGSKIAAALIVQFIKGDITRHELENNYSKIWKKTFNARIKTGRLVQRFFGKIWMTNLFVRAMKSMPALTRWIIRKTHGDPF